MTNLDTLKKLYIAFTAKDTDTIRKIFHPQIEWNQMPGFLPGNGTTIGADDIFKYVFEPFGLYWENWKTVVTDYLDAGDHIIAIGYYEGTNKETGKNMKADFSHIYKFYDGLITTFDQYTDTYLVAKAMGKTQ